MSRKSIAAVVLSGLVIGVVLTSSSVAGAATVTKESPPQAVLMQPAKLTKLLGAEQKVSSGYWVIAQPYPSPYGSLSGMSRIAYGSQAHWAELCSTNHMANCNLLLVGQKVFVPVLGSNTRATVTVPVVKTPQVAPKIQTTTNWVHPLKNNNPTSSCFGWRWGAMHKGIDYPAPYGTPIRAVGYGTVAKAGWNFHGYGISVLISHGNNLYTHYAHASRLAVSPGQHVVPGQVIAYVGSTGDSTGNHLHFEVHANGLWSQINPGPWLRARGILTGC